MWPVGIPNQENNNMLAGDSADPRQVGTVTLMDNFRAWHQTLAESNAGLILGDKPPLLRVRVVILPEWDLRRGTHETVAKKALRARVSGHLTH